MDGCSSPAWSDRGMRDRQEDGDIVDSYEACMPGSTVLPVSWLFVTYSRGPSCL